MLPLGRLPPLVFSLFVENGVDAKWAMSFMSVFIMIGALLLRLGTGTWEEMLQESGRSELVEHETNAESTT